jgi:hypothetical protein
MKPNSPDFLRKLYGPPQIPETQKDQSITAGSDAVRADVAEVFDPNSIVVEEVTVGDLTIQETPEKSSTTTKTILHSPFGDVVIEEVTVGDITIQETPEEISNRKKTEEQKEPAEIDDFDFFGDSSSPFETGE